MPAPDSVPPPQDPSPPESSDDSSVILTDSVMAAVIRESVRRHVPVPQVVDERRHKGCSRGDDPPRPTTVPTPPRPSFLARCFRRFRK